MRESVTLPRIDLVVAPRNDVDVNGANVALWGQLRSYANHPAVEALEIFLAPRDLLDPKALQGLAKRLLQPENEGKGRLRIYGLPSLPEVWADGVPRLLHTDDVWALPRDRHLRDRLAIGPTAIVSDTHCMGHWSIWQTIRDLAFRSPVPFDSIVACSSATAEAFRATFLHYGTPPPLKIECTSRRIDSAGLSPSDPSERAAIRKRLGIAGEGPLAIFLGRVTATMKADLLILAETLAACPNPDVRVAVVGVENMPNYPQVVKQHARAQGVGERLTVHGRFLPSERADFYRAADFFLFPADSLNEAFGLTTVEAMACGLPILASHWDGLKDTLHPDYSFAVPTYAAAPPDRLNALSCADDTTGAFLAISQAVVLDRDRWQAGFDALATDADLRARMGTAARSHYEARFEPSRMEDEWMAARWRQVEEAIREPAEARERRHRESLDAKYEIPYAAQLAVYATHFVEDPQVEMTDRGRAWLAGGEGPPLYGEVRAVTEEEVFAGIAHRVASGAVGMKELSESLADAHHISAGDITYHAMVLAKHGFLRLLT